MNMRRLLCATALLVVGRQLSGRVTSQSLPPEIVKRMVYTWRSDAPVPLEDLRYMTISYYGFDHKVHVGELIVHEKAVDDLSYIFQKLCEAHFPLQSMKLVDEFDGSDEASMAANNTSAFYARKVANTDRWSNHASGLAVDINPLINPWSKGDLVAPKEGAHYLGCTKKVPGMITKDGLVYKLFTERGWQWGGECFYERDGVLDRHHFQKVVPGINETTN